MMDNITIPVSPSFFATIAAALRIEATNVEQSMDSRSELDSHANMIVVGSNCFVLSDTGRTASVNPYNPEYAAKSIPIIDAALLQEYILVVPNALHVPYMTHNLIPPFILREKGIQVNNTPKIHLADPSSDDHAIKFDEHLRIPMKLHGTFSYFVTRKPTVEQLNDADPNHVYMMTPEEFDPHKSSYAQTEDHLVNYDGEVADARNRSKLLISDIEDDPTMTVCAISNMRMEEQTLVNESVLEEDDADEAPLGQPFNVNVASISSIFCERTLSHRLSTCREVLSMMTSLGSTHAHEDDTDFLFKDMDGELDFQEMLSGDDLFTKIAAMADRKQVDLDEVMASVTYAKPSKGVQAAHLAKIWKLDLPTAERTLQATTQKRRHTDNPKMARNYGTNDRMLRYKRINQYFFMDKFFAAKNGGRST
ncbi:unnamed protein product [Cylindrotheca closterium]|uniref:Uncharacterized protein n=1 Tax=Cylindrotheca closterium TaxID=2856 RepID=A0AAD2FKR1_9STRA|nr:unnamed protein product [Cylindrotheca closterium]